MNPAFSKNAAEQYKVQDYARRTPIEGVEWIDLKRFNDDGGSMSEMARLDEQGFHQWVKGFKVRQINYSVMEPLAIKAFHLHKRQTDVWFVPPSDKLLLVLGDVRAGSKTEGVVTRHVLGDGNSRLVRIPPGVAHGCKNLRPATPSAILYFVDVQFSTDANCDEGRLPWDHFGTAVWDVERA